MYGNDAFRRSKNVLCCLILILLPLRGDDTLDSAHCVNIYVYCPNVFDFAVFLCNCGVYNTLSMT